jgi:tRNA A-37 threonylcarbamoyl transferase component Bud32
VGEHAGRRLAGGEEGNRVTGTAVTFREAGWRVTAAASAEGPVRRRLLPDPAAALDAGVVVKRNVYRAAARAEVPGLGTVVLKVHRPKGLADVLRAALRRSRARAEWDAARWLRGAGVPTPEPFVLAERRRGPFLEAAVTAARFLPNRATFVPALLAQPPDKARALLVRAARLVRAMHDRGVAHGDLHSGNVLVGHGPGDRCDLHVIDLHAVRTGSHVSRRTREANLAQWLHSLLEGAGPGGRLRTLRAYLGEGAPAGEVRRAFARIEAAIARRERVRRRSRSRRCVEEGSQFTADVGAGTGRRRRDLALSEVDRLLAAHDRALATGSPAVAKDGRKSRVTRHGSVVVKEGVSIGLLGRVRDLLAPNRFRRGYENAHALSVRGVATAAPLAFVRRGGRAFTLYEDLSALPRLDHRVRAALASREWSRGKRLAVIDASADAAARIHRRGVWHGDWKGCNWLVEEHGRRVAFRLIDTDRVRFPRAVSRSRRLRNVAQLAASIPVVVTRADRLRWWRRYARGTPLAGREAERAVARDVAALLSRKTVVVDEPIE